MQFPKNFEFLQLRETSPGSDDFSETSLVRWVDFKYRFLSITSWLGLGWTINHLRLFGGFRFLLGLCYSAGFIMHALDVSNLRLQFSEMDSVWKAWIIFLLVFDLLAATGLFLKKSWGEFFFLLVAVTQLVAYSAFTDIFGQQLFLVRFHVACLCIYIPLKLIDVWRAREMSTIPIKKEPQPQSQ